MTEFTRIYNRFTGYTTEDCNCQYCAYKGTKKRPCLLDECCCMEERQAAHEREQAAAGGSTAHVGQRDPRKADRICGERRSDGMERMPDADGRSEMKSATTTCRA